MRKTNKTILSLWLLLAVLACSHTTDEQTSAPTVNDLADIYLYNHYIRFHPEKGTLEALPEANNNRLWIPYESRIMEEQAAEDSLYEQLMLIEPDHLNELDQTTYYNLRERLEASKQLRVCNQHLWSFNYMEGFQVELERLSNKQKAENEPEKRALLGRWSQVPELINTEIANNSKGLEQGYVLPGPAIEILIDQIEYYLDSPIEESIFYQPAIGSNDSIFQEELKAIIIDSIYPAFSKLKAYLTDDYLPKARKNYSVTNIPNGSECYLAYARYYTSLKMSKNELIGIGDSLIQSNEQKLLKLGEKIYGVGDQEAILNAFYNDPENYFKDYNELEQQLKSSFNLSKREEAHFIVDPPSEPLKVKRIPKHKEGIDANAYYTSAKQEGDTATMYFDYLMHSFAPKGYLEATVFHEGIPGHHFQHAYLNQLDSIHPINKLIWNAGYGEGWAVYVQTVAEELGWYSSPKSVLTQYFYTFNENVFLNNFLVYRENEIDLLYEIFEKKYNLNKQLTNNHFVSSSTLLGYQLNYGIGNSFIRRLRIHAENILGDDFDIKEFHRECLRHGNIPLTHLERVIFRWIEKKKQQ